MKQRSGGTGKIIGNIFLILIGLGFIGFGLWTYNHQIINVHECNSLIGQLDQLDPHDKSVCDNAPGYIILSVISGLIGMILLIISIILIAFGVKQKSERYLS